MDIKETMSTVAEGNGDKLIFNNVYDRVITAGATSGDSSLYYGMGYCSTAFFWLALQPNTVDFDNALSLGFRKSSMLQLILDMITVDFGAPSVAGMESMHSKQRGILKLKAEGLNKVTSVLDTFPLIPGMINVESFFYVSIYHGIEAVLSKPGSYILQLIVQHERFGKDAISRKHAIGIFYGASGEVVIYDWRGGCYQLNNKNKYQSLLYIFMVLIEYYGTSREEEEFFTLKRYIFTDDGRNALKKRIGVSDVI